MMKKCVKQFSMNLDSVTLDIIWKDSVLNFWMQLQASHKGHICIRKMETLSIFSQLELQSLSPLVIALTLTRNHHHSNSKQLALVKVL